ncbi:potassium channel family protein [Nocardioides sp. MH1]|uniref:potassium channel family protein n=1 Tax=Nocardioides sp. MH1 TaxID=3242490 RepID=UPI0035226AEE
MIGVLVALAGALLVGVATADVFYTVLFPASGRGPVRRPLSRGIDAVFRQSRRLPRRHRATVLAYTGPTQVAATLVAWFVLLLVGWAAVYWPALGDGVAAASGQTDDSWGTAMYFSGYTLTTLGLGDVVAVTPLYRALTVAEAASGFVTFTLVISYFVSVYTTLPTRNAFALSLHQLSGETGRGVEVVGALWREGPMAAAVHLTELAAGLRRLVQTHASYPVLQSFHYRNDYDALPRILQTCWESVALLKTTVEVPPTRPELAGITLHEVENSVFAMCTRVVRARKDAAIGAVPDRVAAQRHAEVLAQLKAFGVPTRDAANATEDYLTASAEWDPLVAGLAEHLLYPWPPQSERQDSR